MNLKDSKTLGRPMKVTLISHSDLLGGASIVTYRLMQALVAEGIDARMLVFTKVSDDDRVEVVSTRGRRAWLFGCQCIRTLMANGWNRKDMFKVSLATVGLPLHRHPLVKEADVIMLGWVFQGFLSIKGISAICRLGKPVVWNMHDMWNLTGICHHAYSCTRYIDDCGKCPFLKSNRDSDISHKVWNRKLVQYTRFPIKFVAVSNWLAERCRESSLMKNLDVSVIPNAFPVDTFFTSPRYHVDSLPINYSKRLIVVAAARLDEDIKGLQYTIDALNYIFQNHPKVASECSLVLMGAMRDPSLLEKLHFSHVWLGRVNDFKLISHVYSSADVVLSTSLYETLPGTLIEGLASGCIPVSFGRGGQSDIIDHKVNGYIAEYEDPKSVAEGILWALKTEVDRDALHEEVRRKFSSTSVGHRYAELFESLLAKRRAAEEK